MIVHLFEDEKFVDATIVNFEKVSVGLNRYIIFSNKKDLRYVTRKEEVVVLSNSSYNLELDVIYKNCTLLVIHFLTPIKLYIIKNKPKHVKVLWSVWGGDAYDHFNKQDFFEQVTLNIRKESLYQSLKRSKVYDFYHLLRYRVKPLRKELETLKQIEFISTVLPYEFEIIKEEFNLTATYIEYNYSINNFNSVSPVNLGGSILLGNSATFSNNHLDIFDIIKSTNKKLVVPLNYGPFGYKDYKARIIYEGNRLFKDNFYPLESFLPTQEYDKILKSCNTMIMYHIRQQGLGNIYMALYLGMRVFLNKKSITYKYMNNVGMIVFALDKDFDLVGIELNKNQKDINKELVIKLQGEEAIIRKLKGVVGLYESLEKHETIGNA